MTVMDRELFEALKAAKMPDDQAYRAAISVAERDKDLVNVAERLTHLEGRVTLLAWMIGFNLAATMAVLWKLVK